MRLEKWVVVGQDMYLLLPSPSVSPTGEARRCNRDDATIALSRWLATSEGRRSASALCAALAPDPRFRAPHGTPHRMILAWVRGGRLDLWHCRRRPELALPARDDSPIATGQPSPSAPHTWVEIELVDECGDAVPGARYEVEFADGSVREGRLDRRGLAFLDRVPAGACTVIFPDHDELVCEWKSSSGQAQTRPT